MKFIILDRDGVINFDSEHYIKSPDEWHAIPGSLEAIADLNRAGYRVLVATNQSGVARGYYDLETLNLIHEKFMRELAAVGGYVDEIFFCPHHPDDHCQCRKPKPGLFDKIKEKYQFDFANTYYVGDSASDIEVALAAGCKPVLVLTGNGEKTRQKFADAALLPVFPNLAAVVQSILVEKNT